MSISSKQVDKQDVVSITWSGVKMILWCTLQHGGTFKALG